MIPFPSKVLVVADYEKFHFEEKIYTPIDFVLSCGDVPIKILNDIYELYRKPIFAVKGNHDTTQDFPKYVTNVHFNIVQHRNWLIGGWQGVPIYKGTGAYEWDDMNTATLLQNLPPVDIFIAHAPIYKYTDKDDYAHQGSEALLQYIQNKQPRYFYHGHVHTERGIMIDRTAVISVFGAKVFTLEGTRL